MKTEKIISCVSVIAMLLFAQMASAAMVDTLLNKYQQQGAGPFSVETGQAFWNIKYPAMDGAQDRQCNTCHGGNLKVSGKHIKTGKVIEPLAPSANAQRLTEEKKIEKWFKRNCKWTLGRECSPQEKGNVLLYLVNL